MRHWTMGLNTDNISNVFCINICCFSTIFYFFGTTMAESSNFIKIVHVFNLYTPIKPYVHCVVSTNDQYQGNGFALEVLALVMPKFKLRSRLRPPDANNCCIFNARLLDNGHCIVTSSQGVRRRCQAATIILSSMHTKSVELWLRCCYATSVAMATAPHEQIGSVVKLDHPNFDEIGSRIRPPDAQISSKSDDFIEI